MLTQLHQVHVNLVWLHEILHMLRSMTYEDYGSFLMRSQNHEALYLLQLTGL